MTVESGPAERDIQEVPSAVEFEFDVIAIAVARERRAPEVHRGEEDPLVPGNIEHGGQMGRDLPFDGALESGGSLACAT